VVISILAILGTIGFIQLQGHSSSARDSSRISDMGNLKKAFELTFIKTGYYPMPSNGS
jgi:type II secretory pathway pseudopilin PulG